MKTPVRSPHPGRPSLVLLSLLLCLLATGCIPAAASTRTNIVFMLIDDMGWADGGCFGSRFYQTPRMDRLAAEGMRFTHAYAACAVCSPTRAALMTGKYPARLHITDWIPGENAPKNSRFRLPEWQQHLPLEERTLADRLHALGYVTAHFGKWHLGGPAYYPEHHGFDVNVAGSDTGQPGSYFWPYGAPTDRHRVPGLAEQGGHKGEYLTDRLTDDAIRFIETNRDKPFYLNFAHYAVHSPLEAKRELMDLAGERPGADGQSNIVYAAMLKSVDESLGRILDKLEELHLADHTIVVFTSDNGGAVHFGKPPATHNGELRLGKGYAYEGGLRVPLLVRVPGVTRAGAVCHTPVISLDFVPTLLDLAGAPPPPDADGLDGLSLAPLLRGDATLPRHELFWHYPHYWDGGIVSPYSVARIDDWKLIRFYETGREELYHLADDPSESRDQAAANPEKRKALAARLDAWLAGVGAQMPVPRR